MFLSMLGSSIIKGFPGNFSRTPESFGALKQLSAKPGILQVAWAHPTHRDEAIFSRDSWENMNKKLFKMYSDINFS